MSSDPKVLRTREEAIKLVHVLIKVAAAQGYMDKWERSEGDDLINALYDRIEALEREIEALSKRVEACMMGLCNKP
jgi:uncharacterized protein YicC (UPF0701 family)